MLKRRYSIIICMIIAVLTGAVYTVYGEKGDIDLCRQFLENYGWRVQKLPTDRTDVTIPAVFDLVYENYNKLQTEASLDLGPYRGMSGARYTFIVENYPVDVGEPVYANVIVINSVPVAGDIMTVSINGFMHSLNKTY